MKCTTRHSNWSSLLSGLYKRPCDFEKEGKCVTYADDTVIIFNAKRISVEHEEIFQTG